MQVETCLAEEVARRSQAFLEAAAQIGELGESVSSLLSSMHCAQGNVRAAAVDMGEQAATASHLQRRRRHLEAMHQVNLRVYFKFKNNLH